jgi:hypothetical protein
MKLIDEKNLSDDSDNESDNESGEVFISNPKPSVPVESVLVLSECARNTETFDKSMSIVREQHVKSSKKDSTAVHD